MLLDGPLSLHYSAVSWRHTRRKLSLSLPLSANSTQQLVKSFPTQRNGVISQTRTSFCTFHINLSEYLIPIRHTTLDRSRHVCRVTKFCVVAPSVSVEEE